MQLVNLRELWKNEFVSFKFLYPPVQGFRSGIVFLFIFKVMDTEQGPSAPKQASDFPWHLGVYDAHCHPTDSMKHIDDIRNMKAKVLTIMATRSQDQDLVSAVATKFRSKNAEAEQTPSKVIPAFGWHPWFSHQIYDDTGEETEQMDKVGHYRKVLTGNADETLIAGFPEPRPLSDLITKTREYLKKHPEAMVGEVGLDRSFCIPENFSPAGQLDEDSELTPGGREGRRLTSHRVDISHQRAILKAQLNLAGELSRPVSVHAVAGHGVVYDTLSETWKDHKKSVVSKRTRKRRGSVSNAHVGEDIDEEDSGPSTGPKPYPPRICLHSYSGPPEALKQYLSPSVPAEVFFSFSQVINFSTSESASDKAREVIKALPEDRILIESDLHCAGERMDGLLEQMVRDICEIRSWRLEEGVQVLRRNWERFALGTYR